MCVCSESMVEQAAKKVTVNMSGAEEEVSNKLSAWQYSTGYSVLFNQ